MTWTSVSMRTRVTHEQGASIAPQRLTELAFSAASVPLDTAVTQVSTELELMMLVDCDRRVWTWTSVRMGVTAAVWPTQCASTLLALSGVVLVRVDLWAIRASVVMLMMDELSVLMVQSAMRMRFALKGKALSTTSVSVTSAGQAMARFVDGTVISMDCATMNFPVQTEGVEW